jgi:hypothetical protein
MKTTTVTALVISLALAACGGKAKKATTPDIKGTDSQMKTDGSTGGASYGGTTAPKGGNGSGGTADPCGG